jgi:glyceraldehyde 3-phosphate dehydrogenase
LCLETVIIRWCNPHSGAIAGCGVKIKVGINGFGRMGRLVMRVAWDWPDVEFVQINEPAGDSRSLAHLLEFDSVHGRWNRAVTEQGDTLLVEGQPIRTSRNTALQDTDWQDCDCVVEASGCFRRRSQLQPYIDQGVRRVVVTAPVKDEGVPNVVMGVNEEIYDEKSHEVVTAASCTTNCLAPIVKVIYENIGIRHASFTTVHDVTNTQSILDQHHPDLRRARASGLSLIPTTTGSARAITQIFPALAGRIDGHAIRVPLANASLTDITLEVERRTSDSEVNELLSKAASGALEGVLGFEERPLVSVDYRTDPRSCVIDALSTRVINGTQVKLYAWYDNEWGYA